LALLQALECLDLEHNKLTQLPLDIGQLQSLRTLNLNHNLLDQVTNIHHTGLSIILVVIICRSRAVWVC
jgi:Leucine-rich repeat (LRR) protein